VRIKDDKVYADIEKASSGTVDAQIEKDLESATSPKERYKIALEAYETGFMDEDAFQAELELLASKMPQDKVAEIIAEADVENYPLGWY
jgi:hypothetical protein